MNRSGRIAKALFLLTSAAFLASCGGSGDPVQPSGPVVETYKVLSDSVWTVFETSNGSTGGWVEFIRSDAGVSFGSWNAAGSQLLAVTTNAVNSGPDDETWLLKYPLTAGATWSALDISKTATVRSATVVDDVATSITVPAGTFVTAVTTETITFPPGYDSTRMAINRHTRYFAPGVGLVKVVATRLNGSVITGELQSFSVSNPDPSHYFPLAVGDSWTFKWVST